MFEVLTTLNNKSSKGNHSIKKINTNKKLYLDTICVDDSFPKELTAKQVERTC